MGAVLHGRFRCPTTDPSELPEGQGRAPLAESPLVEADALNRSSSPRATTAIVVTLLALGLLPSAVLAAEPPEITVNTTADPVSGSPFSFEPVYPDGFVIPEDTTCQYELRWGDDDSLLLNLWNQTFGSVIVRGTKAAGYCDGWEFTLPYSQAGQWQWSYSAGDVDYNPPGDGFPMFTGTNDSPEWSGITESTLPGVWLSMTRNATIGSTIEVIAHPFGGYTMPAGGANWAAYAPGDDAESHVAESHSLTFSFVPLTGGNWSSFYNDTGSPNFAGAGIDPEVGVALPTVAPTAPPAPTAAATSTRRPTVTPPATDAAAISSATPDATSLPPILVMFLLNGLLLVSIWMRRRSR